MQFLHSPTLKAGGRWINCLLFASFFILCPSAFADLVKINDHSEEISKRIQARLALANAYHQAGMSAIAFEEVDKALMIAPRSSLALMFKAILLQQQHKNELAEKHFNLAAELNPESPEIAHHFGVFLCQAGRFESSFSKFEIAMKQSMGISRDATEWVWGQCLIKNDQLAEADERMSRALAHQPDFFRNSEQLITVKMALHSFVEAEKISDRLNESSSVSAQSLWLGIQLAERHQKTDKKKQWAKMLEQLFPTSKQWQQLQDGPPYE
jgi:type IV pilus assembly protein PilF